MKISSGRLPCARFSELFEDPAGALSKVKAVSFDVFDTLVTRKYAYPTDLFFLVERRLGKLDPKFSNYAEKRISTELETRKKNKFSLEITLKDIYDKLKFHMKLSDHEMNIVKETEIHSEIDAVYPIVETIELASFLVESGKKVVFMSDTYFSEKFIRKIMIKCGIIGIDSDYRVYVSSANGKQKSTGMLYHDVLEKERLKASDICHIGDNRESDCRVPKQLGIRAVHYSGSELNRYERSLYSAGDAPVEVRSLLAGLCKVTRLACPYKDARSRTIWDVAANVAGPLITGYVRWCLEQAEASGLKTLYFMSRDGQIALKIALILKNAFDYKVRLKYLYVSRQSLLMPTMRDDNEDELNWIFLPTSKLTFKILFDRLHLCLDEILDILKRHGFEPRGPDDPILPADLEGIREVIRDPRFKRVLGRKIREQNEMLFRYLHQEGLDQDEAFGLVDIGWSGSLQRSISRVLEDHSKMNPVTGFYFGLKHTVRNKETDSLRSYYEFSRPGDSNGETQLVPMLEVFFAADHGPVISFEREGDRVAPVLKTESNEMGIRWGVLTQQQGIEAFARMIAAEGRDMADYLMNNKEAHLKNLKDFFLNPSDREALVYGSYLYSEEQKEAYHLPLAARYSIQELIRHRLFGYMHHHDEWVYAARKMSNKMLCKLLHFR